MNQNKDKQKTIADKSTLWVAQVHEKSPELDADLLRKACEFAHSYIEKKATPYAENCFTQGLMMAEELLLLNCDSQTIAAAIIYPAIYYNQIHIDVINKKLNKSIGKLLMGAEKMEALQYLSSQNTHSALQAQHTDNTRKMLLAMVDDIRVVLIKLAEHLAILKYVKNCEKVQQQNIAKQTINIYAPLANRLGIGQLKWQLEDLSFRYLNPQEYMNISKSLKMRRVEREQFIHDMIEQLTQTLRAEKINKMEITGRAKHIYSIHKKMQRKGLDISELYDTSALRILVPNIKDCYTALSATHATWKHIAKEFDDYIAKPKPNGYQSIHTAIVGPHNINVEIQIRTYSMHEESELGVAAHWKYKEGNADSSSYEDKIKLLREVMDWQKEVSHESEQQFKQIFQDRIYVFTPQGHVFDLAAGATPLDFAYHIHTDIGHRCKGAKVNNQLVTLTHTLKTGDQVNILTSKEPHPSRDWLDINQGYLKTSHARAKVRHWFRKESHQENLRMGWDIWEKTSRREHIHKADLEKVYARFNFKNSDDLIAAIGSGNLGIATVIHQIKQQNTTKETADNEAIHIQKPSHKQHTTKDSALSIQGVDNLLTQLARCCKPIPGDPIIGYITKGKGISIHHQDCRNIQQAIAYRANRIIEVNWGTKAPQAYPVDLIMHAEDRPGLVRDISNVIANENITLLGLNTRVNKIKNEAYINLTIEIKSLDPLQKILGQLRQINGITQAKRA